MSNTIAYNTAKEVVYALYKKYGFDNNEAWEYVMNTKAVKDAMEENLPSDASDTGSSSDNEKKIATCKKNIELWQKKLDEGKVKDVDKQIEKIDKEKKKLQKLEGTDISEKKEEKKLPIKQEEKKDSESDSSSTNESKIATCKKNIELWQKKLDEGKVKDADKQIEKIDKEKKKLQKLEESQPPRAGNADVKTIEKTEKRMGRFSPVMTKQFTEILAGVDVVITDKLKKEFREYIEDLSDDVFGKDGFADHMRTFANSKAPTKPKKDDAIEESSDKSGATGPAADPDEDFDEVTFEGKKYVVGENTGRVYEAHDSGDVFAGFLGVGKFKTMTR
jgi:hypothetical protein